MERKKELVCKRKQIVTCIENKFLNSRLI